MARLADYKQRWLPLQQALGTQVTEMGAAGSAERKRGAGMAATDTDMAFDKAQAGLERTTAQRRDFGSSSHKLAVAGLDEDRATSKALGIAGVDEQIDDAYVQGLSQIMAIGQGQRANAVEGMGQVAAMSGRQAAYDAQASLENRMGNAELAGQVVGMGAGMAGRRGGVNGTNDFKGVNGSNAMDMWLRLGSGGD